MITKGQCNGWWKTATSCAIRNMIPAIPVAANFSRMTKNNHGQKNGEGNNRHVPLQSDHPTLSFISSSMSRFISTAYSRGSMRTIGSMKPFTIMALACSSAIPRDVR